MQALRIIGAAFIFHFVVVVTSMLLHKLLSHSFYFVWINFEVGYFSFYSSLFLHLVRYLCMFPFISQKNCNYFTIWKQRNDFTTNNHTLLTDSLSAYILLFILLFFLHFNYKFHLKTHRCKQHIFTCCCCFVCVIRAISVLLSFVCAKQKQKLLLFCRNILSFLMHGS